MSSQESVGSDIYSGAAGVGRFSAIIGAVIATIVGVGFIVGGIYLVARTDNKTGGWVLIIVGLLAIIISWIWVYLTQRSKFLAAAGGVDTGLQIISAI